MAPLVQRFDATVQGVLGPGSPVADCIPFATQAIISAIDRSLYGYELLYRGTARPGNAVGWANIDAAVLASLGDVSRSSRLPLFVNLAHASLLAIPDQVFEQAARVNNIRFEISEAVVTDALFDQVCDKVNRLTALGLLFVLDDFGAGIDGNRRLFSLDRVEAIKIDRELLVSATRRQAAAAMLRSTVRHWNEAGILTVAEGVETRELLDFAVHTGFSLLQGYHVDTFAKSGAEFI